MLNNWTEFRNLCSYYIDCLKYEDKSQDCFYLDQKGTSFMVPSLPPNWHKKEEFEIETKKEDLLIKEKLLKASDDNELFIGYPLHVSKTYEGVERFFPIVILPISVSVRGEGYTSGLKVKVNRQGASINHEWLERYVDKEDHNLFLKSFETANDELGYTNIDLVLCFLSNKYQINDLDPNFSSIFLRESKAENHILNTATIYIANKPKYTKNLLSELRKISNEPDSVLDQTSLAYIFRTPVLPNKSINDGDDNSKLIPVSFTNRRLNAGQFEAVEKALNTPLVTVKGPPGTGKSFMAVNLIANEVINGGRVLFTSKNHKAVHAIFNNAAQAISDDTFPLVQFCTVAENPNNMDWRKSQENVDIRIDKANAIKDNKLNIKFNDAELTKIDTPYIDRLNIALSRYRDAEKYIDQYQRSRYIISEFEKLLVEIEDHIKEIPFKNKDDIKTIDFLESIDRILSETYIPSFWEKIVIFIKKALGKGGNDFDIIFEQLKEIAPETANVFFSKETIQKDIKRLLRVLKYKLILRQWESEEIDVLKNESSKFNYEDLTKTSKKTLDEASEVVQNAYRETILRNLYSLKDSETIVEVCQRKINDLGSSLDLDFMLYAKNESTYIEAVESFQEYLKIFPAWAAVMLSLNHASPCLPGIYSLAIIDEAAQCEIPPMIPVLFRSKRVAIIGDPDQFPPVITLKEKREKTLRRKYKIDGIEYQKFLYREENTAFSVSKGFQRPILLNEHFRCTDDIADYFNSEFYNSNLSLCCEYGRGTGSSMINVKRGMMWNEAVGGDDAEIEAAIDYLRDLKKSNYSGEIGLISPLKRVVEKIQKAVKDNENEVPSQIDIQSDINTAHGFQGGERDIILFILGLNADRKHGEEWYITSPEKKYIYNVTVSRAKHLFVAFGDKARVKESGIPYIQRLIPEMHKPRNPKIGPGEIRLKLALDNAGIKTEQQYPIAGRYLDLAIPDLKIDIEVDGQAFHQDVNGCRKADDIHRDITLEGAGWHVIRFWHYEIVNNVDACVTKIKEKIHQYSKMN